MTDENIPQGDEEPRTLTLPKHLAALVGSLEGPADLGRNHDRYLAYPDRDHPGTVASA
jgi:hypothetical protein